MARGLRAANSAPVALVGLSFPPTEEPRLFFSPIHDSR